MIHSRYPDTMPDITCKHAIFLAGDPSSSSDWQLYVVDELYGTNSVIFDSRVFSKSGVSDRINWENDRIDASNIIIFWCAQNTINPGMFLKYSNIIRHSPDSLQAVRPDRPRAERTLDKKVFVGCHPLYKYKDEIAAYTRNLMPEDRQIYIYDRLDEITSEVKEYIRNAHV